MKRIILLVVLVLACSGVASANAIDPTIILDGPSGGSQPVPGLTFAGAFTPTGTPAGNNCPANVPTCFDGQNQSGFHWIALSITYTFAVASLTPLIITCSSNLFDVNNCGDGLTVTPTGDPTATVTLNFSCSAAALASSAGCGIFNFTPNLTGAIGSAIAGSTDFVNYVDPNSAGASDILSTTFTAAATPAPEPGTVALLFAGIGTVALRRKWRKGGAGRS
jgi:hypothetical protein